MLPPKTPLLDELDLFSPTISDPSEPRPERGDTPPPPDLGSDTGMGSLGRASRRSRGSVSYAEPSLRDKMRRPTKDLVDAVSRSHRAQQSFGERLDDHVSSLEAGLEKLSIKPGEMEVLQQRWPIKPAEESRSQQARQRAETSSPLGNKANSAAAVLPASVVTDRRRRTSAMTRMDEDDSERKQSGSATAIAALSGPAQRRGRQDGQANQHEGNKDAMIADQMDRASIFDFTPSSPEQVHPTRNREAATAKATRSTRRHSSVPSINSQVRGKLTVARREREPATRTEIVDDGSEQGPDGDPMGDQDQVPPDVSTIGRAAGRRRSMMI